jgi:hypothetical protein
MSEYFCMLSLVIKLMIVIHLQVESIVLSIISMLSSPNDESPANIEAAVSSPNSPNNLLYTLCTQKNTDLVYWTSSCGLL